MEQSHQAKERCRCQAYVQNEADVEGDVKRWEIVRLIKNLRNGRVGGRQSHSCWFSDMFDEVGGGEILSGGSCERGSLHRLE